MPDHREVLIVGDDGEDSEQLREAFGALELKLQDARAGDDLITALRRIQRPALVVVVDAGGELRPEPGFVDDVKARDRDLPLVWVAKQGFPRRAQHAPDLIAQSCARAGLQDDVLGLIKDYLYPREIVEQLLDAAQSVLKDSYEVRVRRGREFLRASPNGLSEVGAVVMFLSNAITGCLAVSASRDTFLQLHRRLVPNAPAQTDEEGHNAAQTARELANQVASQLRNTLLSYDVDLRCGFPVVSEKASWSLTYRPGRTACVLELQTGLGQLFLEVYLNNVKKEQLQKQVDAEVLEPGSMSFFD